MIEMKESPNVVFIKTTECCNLKCIQCDYHKNNPNNKDNITIEDKVKIIHEIKEWNENIRVSLTGGEPFVRKDILFRLAEECKKLGIKASVTTNGTLIKNEDLKSILDLELDFILISIDSNEEKIHNDIRGVDTAFELATTFAKNIIELRNTINSNTKIYVSTLLGKHNLNNIKNVIEFFNEIGFDGVFFQAIQPNFSSEFEDDWIQNSPLYPSYEEAEKGINDILELKNKYNIISQTKEQFKDMLIYFKNPLKLPFKKCEAMNSTIIINDNGETQFCFDMERVGKKSSGNIKNKTLKEIWNDNIELRRKMCECQYGCGIMNCHYKDE